ncbi:MAG: 2-dehydropantoate 2-reductase [Acidisphaera sp.]|nr:2-dehydropantoate 2-reductase [Acidisphaera sp.]
MPGVCIFGAGAIGGLMAARLAAAGTDVTVVARGPHLAAMQADGLTLLSGPPLSANERLVVHPRVVQDPREAGPQDFLVLTLKAHSLQPALPQLRPLIGPQTTIVAAVNGIPWWYFYGVEGAYADRLVHAVDPEGALWEALPPAQTIGCIIYPAAEIVSPGVVSHTYGDRFTLGEPDGSRSERIERLARLLIGAGFKAPIRPRLRDEIWLKLWGNMALNPVSALTTATLDVILADPGTRATVRAMMLEGRAVAERLGIRFALTVDKRIEGAEEVGRHRTSMLQDLERGRPLEIEALLGAVVEIAEWVDVDVPISRVVLALVRQRAAIG